MQEVNEFKGIKTSNIPTHNLREQFYNHYNIVKSEEFVEDMRNWEPGQSIKTPYISWLYWPEQFFTFLTQLSVVGLESYICSAVYFELGMCGKLKENIGYIRNPYSLKGKGGTAAKYYKLLPALVSEEVSMSICNPELWQEVRVFYNCIRNPLFHGKQLDKPCTNDLISIFELLADVYGWIDSWHDPDKIIPGSSWFTKLERDQ